MMRVADEFMMADDFQVHGRTLAAPNRHRRSLGPGRIYPAAYMRADVGTYGRCWLLPGGVLAASCWGACWCVRVWGYTETATRTRGLRGLLRSAWTTEESWRAHTRTHTTTSRPTTGHQAQHRQTLTSWTIALLSHTPAPPAESRNPAQAGVRVNVSVTVRLWGACGCQGQVLLDWVCRALRFLPWVCTCVSGCRVWVLSLHGGVWAARGGACLFDFAPVTLCHCCNCQLQAVTGSRDTRRPPCTLCLSKLSDVVHLTQGTAICLTLGGRTEPGTLAAQRGPTQHGRGNHEGLRYRQ